MTTYRWTIRIGGTAAASLLAIAAFLTIVAVFNVPVGDLQPEAVRAAAIGAGPYIIGGTAIPTLAAAFIETQRLMGPAED